MQTDGHLSVTDTGLLQGSTNQDELTELKNAFLLDQYLQAMHSEGLSAGKATIRIGDQSWQVAAVPDLLDLALLKWNARYLLVPLGTVIPTYPMVEFAVDAANLHDVVLVPPLAEQHAKALSELLPMLRTMESDFDS